MKRAPAAEWEIVHEAEHEKTERMKVPGGWLYRSTVRDRGPTMCFVPTPKPR